MIRKFLPHFIALAVSMMLQSCLNSASPPGSLTPSTAFESGAALDIHQRSDGAIAFSIPLDPGGPEYLWFYFSLTGKVKKGQVFALENAAAAHQTGNRWAITRPVFSADGKIWVRAEEVDYSREFSLRHPLGLPVFHFKSPIDADTLRVAYCYPYTSRDLNEFLASVNDRLPIQIKSIGRSEEGRDILSFQLGLNNTDSLEPPQEIWVIGREHPGETPASFVLEGMVEALLEKSSTGQHLTDSYVITFVPILNVDGVAHGYYYHNAKGKNLARDWDLFNSVEVRDLRAAMLPSLQMKNIRLVIDLHASNDPSLGHFFLERPPSLLIPKGERYRPGAGLRTQGLDPTDAEFQSNFLNVVDGIYPQLQGKSTVRMLDEPGITGNSLYTNYDIYCLYLESNYSRGADGSPVTPQSLRETGKALIHGLTEALLGD